MESQMLAFDVALVQRIIEEISSQLRDVERGFMANAEMNMNNPHVSYISGGCSGEFKYTDLNTQRSGTIKVYTEAGTQFLKAKSKAKLFSQPAQRLLRRAKTTLPGTIINPNGNPIGPVRSTLRVRATNLKVQLRSQVQCSFES